MRDNTGCRVTVPKASGPRARAAAVGQYSLCVCDTNLGSVPGFILSLGVRVEPYMNVRVENHVITKSPKLSYNVNLKMVESVSESCSIHSFFMNVWQFK